MRTLLLTLAVLVSVVLSAARADAQDGAARKWAEWRAVGDGVVAIETSWSAADAAGKRKASVSLRKLDSALAPVGNAISVYDGAVVMTALAAHEGSAAIVLFNGSAQPFVKVAIVDLSAPPRDLSAPPRDLSAPRRDLASKSVRLVDLARTAGADYVPSSAVVSAEAGGFAILWQEEKRGDPSAEARSTLARVKADGTFAAAPKSVPIPWSLGAIADDGRGYTLAVNFDGAAPDQTRVCFVTLTREGQPEQHPWWGSRPGTVADVQLVAKDGKVTALWRSGADGQSILMGIADKQNGQWGKDPPPSAVLARSVATDAPFTARAKGNAIEIVKR